MKMVKDGLDGDNDDSEKDVTPTKPGPACHEALQAVLMLQEYIGTINDPFVCKLEVMLNSFGWVTRAVRILDATCLLRGKLTRH